MFLEDLKINFTAKLPYGFSVRMKSKCKYKTKEPVQKYSRDYVGADVSASFITGAGSI